MIISPVGFFGVFPLRRQCGYDRRDTVARIVELTVAAKPDKVAACISVRAGQTVGRRRGKLAAGFQDDLNILGTVTQLAAAKERATAFRLSAARSVGNSRTGRKPRNGRSSISK